VGKSQNIGLVVEKSNMNFYVYLSLNLTGDALLKGASIVRLELGVV